MGELNEKNQMCTLTRGKLAPEFIHVSQLQEILFDDRPEVEGCHKLEAIKTLCEFASGRYYDRIYYRVLFRTDRSINLQSLGFWGPHKEPAGVYKVKIIISKLSTLCVAKQKVSQLYKFEVVQAAKRKEIFFVPLEKPVHLTTGGWTQIEFSLNGPPTAQSEEIRWGQCTGEGGVNFDFSSSSRQLPVIKYKICRQCKIPKGSGK